MDALYCISHQNYKHSGYAIGFIITVLDESHYEEEK